MDSAAKASASSVATVTITAFDPGANGNRVLVVGLTFGQGAPATVAVKYGGVALTLAPGTSQTQGNAHTEIWYLTNPSTTAANIVATWTGSHDVVMGALGFSGANQVTPVINGTSASATTTAISLTITSAVNDVTMDTVGTLSVTSPFLSAPTQGKQWLDTTPLTVKGGASTADGAATVTHKWTAGSAVAWTASGVDIKAAIGYQVGSFTKSTSVTTQTIPHNLGQVPKAVILWTEARSDSLFSNATPIAFRAAAKASAVAATTLTITKPAGTALNDVMIASIAVQPSTVTIAPPAGWTLVRNTKQATATSNELSTYYKVAGAAEGASYIFTFTTTTPTGSAGGIASFTGVDVVNPIDLNAGQANASSLNQPAPAVTTTSINDMIVTAHTMSSSITFTAPAGMTETVDQASGTVPNNAGQSLEMNYVLQAAIGTTGTKTAVASAQAGTGAAHTVALMPAYQSYFAFGFSDGTTGGSGSSSSQTGVATSAVARRMANKVITVVRADQTLLAEADMQSWSTTGFTLNWTTNDSLPYIIHYLLIAGSDVSAKVVNWQMPTAVGDVAVTGVGFQPTAVIHLHTGSGFTFAIPNNGPNSGFGLGVMDFGGTQWATEMFAADAKNPADTQRNQATDAAIYTIDNGLGITKKGSFKSMDADGFTVNFGTVSNTNKGQIFSLALLGVNVKAGSFIKTTAAAPVSQSITGTGFQPSAVFFHSFQDVPQAAPVVHSRMSYGASDGTTSGSSAFSDLNAVSPTNFQAIDKTTKAFMKTDNSTDVIDAEADLTSLDADGFTLNWTTNDAVGTEILYMGLANLVNTEVRLISFDGARYPRGALLQWKTGYEINNLGFNLYREIDGVRTRVNTTLIAGSGLQAGQSVAVAGQLAYARWDLEPVPPGKTVTYWLDDVEFNGRTTEHGPLTPAVNQLQDPSTVAPDSAELGGLGSASNSRRIFFNYNEDPIHPGPRAVPAQVAPEVTRQWALASQATVKMGVWNPGWYRVTQPELIAAGLNPSVDSRSLQLFVNGTEQAIRVNGATNGAFHAGDSIEFYASGTDTPYTDTRIYWLQAGAQTGRRIATAGGGAPTLPAPTGFSSTLRRRDRVVYAAGLDNGETENWFGATVYSDPTDLVLTPPNIDRSVPGTAQLTVTLQGLANPGDGGAGHRVDVLVNGTDLGEMTFGQQAYANHTFTFPVPTLLDGTNTVTLVARGGDLDISLVDTIKLDYPHAYQADADRLQFTVNAPGSIAVGGFAGTSIRVFDITDRTAPIELPNQSPSTATATVYVSGTGPRTLIAFSGETILTPAFVQANHPSTWHAASQAHDYVLISHPDFISQTDSLVALRKRQGHTPAVVDVTDIYDEFSFGERTPQAIKDFLQWARTNWRQAPRFVVLLGDATIDPRDYAEMGDGDFVPSKLVSMAAQALETPSDDWFVDFDNNGLPDVSIGRLSVRTADQAAATIAKIVGYESGPPQAWTKNVLLVAGKSDSLSNFVQLSAALGVGVPNDYTVNKVFTDTLGSSDAHQAIIDRVNDGQLIVNYAGHGSVQLWGGDGGPTLLTNNDVEGVTASFGNAGRLPFVVAMSCLNGLFDQIYGEESLAEAMMRAPNAGAVAVWASSSVTPPATQSLVNQELFRLIFQGTFPTLGEAVASAKRVVTNSDLRKSWIFFGDPAMHLSGAPQPADHRTPWTPPPPTSAPPPTGSPDSGTPGARTINVAAGDDLQAAINRAVAGDTIRLEAGATFVGNFVLPAKGGDAFVTIRSATPDAALPGTTARIDPAQARLLATIQSPNANPALATQPGANHYRLLFLEFGPNAKGAGDIIRLGDGTAAQYALGSVPHDLEIDRCYIHGGATLGQKRAISLNSASTSITNSYIADIKAVDAGSQAISGWNGPGPYTIVNNYLEAAGENVLLGGADPSIDNLVPSDVTLRLNYLSKPSQSRTQNWRVGNLVVLKNAERVSIDSNVLENNVGAALDGVAVLVAPRNNQDGSTPWVRVDHVQFTNNIVRHVPAAISLLDPNGTATDIAVRNNLFSDVSSAYGGTGQFLLITGGVEITIDHNTVFQDGSAVVYAYGTQTIGFVFTNNIVPASASAVMGDGSNPGNETVQRYFAGGVWLGNVMSGAPSATYPSGNFYPASMSAIGFVSLARGNYRLSATSAYRHAATDNTDPGYDVDALIASVPPSFILCSGTSNLTSSAGNPVQVALVNPILAAGSAPAGIACVLPADSRFSSGATTVTCSTVDLFARTASCSIAVTVPSAFAGSSASSFIVTAPGVATSTEPLAATPLSVVAVADVVVPTVNQRAGALPVTNATAVGSQPITPLGASLAFTADPGSTFQAMAAASTPQPVATSFATPMFTIPAMDGGAPTADVTPPITKTTPVSPTSEPIETPTSGDAPRASEPREPKDSKPSKMDRVELTSDVASPQVPGTTLRLTATPSGGAGPYQYQWRVMDGSTTWSLPTEWSESATFTWTPATPAADLGIMVGARSASSLDDTPEARAIVHFVIKAVPPVGTPTASAPPAGAATSGPKPKAAKPAAKKP